MKHNHHIIFFLLLLLFNSCQQSDENIGPDKEMVTNINEITTIAIKNDPKLDGFLQDVINRHPFAKEQSLFGELEQDSAIRVVNSGGQVNYALSYAPQNYDYWDNLVIETGENGLEKSYVMRYQPTNNSITIDMTNFEGDITYFTLSGDSLFHVKWPTEGNTGPANGKLAEVQYDCYILLICTENGCTVRGPYGNCIEGSGDGGYGGGGSDYGNGPTDDGGSNDGDGPNGGAPSAPSDNDDEPGNPNPSPTNNDDVPIKLPTLCADGSLQIKGNCIDNIWDTDQTFGKLCDNINFQYSASSFTAEIVGLGGTYQNTVTNQVINIELGINCVDIPDYYIGTSHDAALGFSNIFNTARTQIELELESSVLQPNVTAMRNRLISIITSKLQSQFPGATFGLGACQGNISETIADYGC